MNNGLLQKRSESLSLPKYRQTNYYNHVLPRSFFHCGGNAMHSGRIIVIFLALAPCVSIAAGMAQDKKPAGSVAPQEKKAKDKEPAFDESFLDEKTLREAKLGVQGEDLLQYFRERTHQDADPQRLAQLVADLGDDRFVIREKAYAELLALGQTALPALKEAETRPKEEVRLRATELKNRIQERDDPLVQSAVARLIGHRKPPEAAAVLLGFLPFAANDAVVDDICKALCQVTVVSGKAAPVVVAGLADKLSIKRGATGMALAVAGATDHIADVKKLLADSEPAVRLRVSQALIENVRDRDAVQTLIDCLKDLPAEKTWPGEELLLRIAGETGPRVSLGTDPPSRAKCFEEWNRWWRAHANEIDLAKIDFTHALLGYTVIAFQPMPKAGIAQRGGTILELDEAKNVRWKFEVPTLGIDAQVVGPDRVLVVERNGLRITERAFSGDIKWEKAVNNTVLSAQRLPSGNTFVVMQDKLVEYDVQGAIVYTYNTNNIYRGRKMRNGDVVCITLQGVLTRLDSKTNNTLKSFNVGALGNLYGTLEELPSGNLLIPLFRVGQVVEYAADGKEVWSVKVPGPTSATRLPNGNTLVASSPSVQVQRRVVEFDRNQRDVWSYNVDGYIYVARKR
jgi:hypothetical protein